jgi:hypothetical protein
MERISVLALIIPFDAISLKIRIITLNEIIIIDRGI